MSWVLLNRRDWLNVVAGSRYHCLSSSFVIAVAVRLSITWVSGITSVKSLFVFPFKPVDNRARCWRIETPRSSMR